MAPPAFDGENYQACAVRMQAYIEGCDFWEAVEEDYEVAPLLENPTINQIKFHKEKITRKAKAKSCLYSVVSPAIFSRIMACESAKAIWDFLKAEYQGDERIRSMKGLNLIREFERLQMNESETIEEHSDKLISIANQAKILGTDLSDNRLVQKILVFLPERFEATIASLENTKDLSQIKLTELLSALQAQEQRRLMRLERSIKGALKAKEQHNVRRDGSSGSEVAAGENNAVNSKNNWGKYSSCKHCGKHNHPDFRCWRRPDIKCRKFHRLGHIESWLVDSGCTNHMTSDEKLFIDLDKSLKSRVIIGNGEYLEVKGQLVEKGFKVTFEEGKCLIIDSSGQELFRIKMQQKSFSLNPLEKEQVAFKCQASDSEMWHKRLGHFHYKGLLFM
ncbi:uncharacterized protein LOC133294328 [Gastrolobium bilobum]|uniref:uncharacterized protein LOC133294328 n=1 Tax=Gastrolobium bilobum TaxID=150636 RepID=UPI002AB121F6|nr:uncharacterized protein LOC133294328 [Gastrolobium bilobum]